MSRRLHHRRHSHSRARCRRRLPLLPGHSSCRPRSHRRPRWHCHHPIRRRHRYPRHRRRSRRSRRLHRVRHHRRCRPTRRLARYYRHCHHFRCRSRPQHLRSHRCHCPSRCRRCPRRRDWDCRGDRLASRRSRLDGRSCRFGRMGTRPDSRSTIAWTVLLPVWRIRK